jgi:hypothetical protein
LGTAENHHEGAAIVAKEAAVGIENDFVWSCRRGGGEQEKRPEGHKAIMDGCGRGRALLSDENAYGGGLHFEAIDAMA